MCLAVPGRILSIEQRHGLRVGRVEFGGVVREANLEFLPEAGEGDYVLVHVGFALSKVDEEDAKQTLALLQEMGLTDEVGPA